MFNAYLLMALGFIAQSMFGARTVAQWIISEREQRVVSPSIFWTFSVIGSSLFLLYGVLRHDIVIIFGQTIAFYIYVRNLQLKGVWKNLPQLVRYFVLIIPALLLAYLSVFDLSIVDLVTNTDLTDTFLLIGAVGQLLLNFRYFYQWYFSEKARESLLPLGFWVISAFASVLVVIYGIYRNDVVLLVAQSAGLVAYARNIYFHFRSKRLSNVSKVDSN